jgi:type IV pilus assembly protein PilP
MSFYRYLGLIAVGLISGCAGSDKSDLEQYIASVLARKGGQVAALPAIKPYERYLYSSADNGLRDPFVATLDQEKKVETVGHFVDLQQEKFNDEIRTHNSEELEAFELDTLRMVGSLQSDNALWAIIKDNTGTVHRVQVGNYLGRNFGKVLDIKEDRLELREIVKDSEGRWEERNASLALAEEK